MQGKDRAKAGRDTQRVGYQVFGIRVVGYSDTRTKVVVTKVVVTKVVGYQSNRLQYSDTKVVGYPKESVTRVNLYLLVVTHSSEN